MSRAAALAMKLNDREIALTDAIDSAETFPGQMPIARSFASKLDTIANLLADAAGIELNTEN